MLHASAGGLKKIGHFADPRTINVPEADKILQASAMVRVRKQHAGGPVLDSASADNKVPTELMRQPAST